MGTEEAWEGNFEAVVRKEGSSQERELSTSWAMGERAAQGHSKVGELPETNTTDQGEG